MTHPHVTFTDLIDPEDPERHCFSASYNGPLTDDAKIAALLLDEFEAYVLTLGAHPENVARQVDAVRRAFAERMKPPRRRWFRRSR